MASAIHQRESVIGIPVSLPSWALLPFPSPHPSRWSQSTGFGLPVSYINSHWLSVLHMVMCMFPCCSLKSYHPLLLPLLHPKICSLCPCLLCCPACRIIGAIFLDSVKVKVNLTQSCLTLCDPMDSIVHGILQARILEWVVFPSPGDLPNPRIKPRSPTLQACSLPTEPQGKPKITGVGSLSLLQGNFLT